MYARLTTISDSSSVDTVPLTPMGVWMSQFWELLQLRFLMARRNLGVTLSQLLIGAVSCAMLCIFQALANKILSSSTDHYPALPVGEIPRCSAISGTLRPTFQGDATEEGCYTLLFAPNTTEMYSLISRAISKSPGLQMGVDVAPVPGLDTSCGNNAWVNNSLFVSLGDSATCSNSKGSCVQGFDTSGWCVPCSLACDNRTMAELTTNYPSSVQTLVWGVASYFPFGDLSYSISYNLSLTQFPFRQPARAAEVKRAIDEALLSGKDIAQGPSLEYKLRDFPSPPPRISGFDVFSQSGGQWTFLVAALLFFQLLTSIAVEKEEKLRVGMRQMGLRASAYWCSWAIFSIGIALCSSFVLLAAGYASGFTFFTNSTPLITFPLYFATSLSYAAFALLLSSLVTTGKSAQQLGYSVALVSFMFIAVVGSGSGVLLNLLYSAQLKPWMVAVRQALLFISPALAYTTVLYDVSNLASNTLDLSAQRVVPGPGFTVGDILKDRSIEVLGYTCNVPSPAFHLGVIVFDGLLYIILGLYLDTVLPGPQGSPAHPLFFLGCSYRTAPWIKREEPGQEDPGVCEERDAAAANPGSSSSRSSSSSSGGATASGETQPSSSSFSHNSMGAGSGLVVRISNLYVVYRSGWTAMLYTLFGIEWGRSSSSVDGAQRGNNSSEALGAGDVYAVSGLSLTVSKGEIVALLGHNGAGKTTSINVLTGLISAAAGVAEVAGSDVVAGQRPPNPRAMGVCPQHDLLFPLLTAREMLSLFCALKGIPRGHWQAEIAEVLDAVKLADVADRGTGTYSGGMKRRLSVALAALGRPPLLLFDEPSTGLDPLARQDLLNLIQSLKRTSGILLTTHSMAEASALGDRVAIMAQGKLVCLGTTVEITQRYGKGYLVSMTLKGSGEACFEGVREGVRGVSPAAVITLKDGAAATFTVPFAAVHAQLPPLLHWCDVQVEGGGLITEFGVSGPSLEEAFLTVTAASHFTLAEQALAAASSPPKITAAAAAAASTDDTASLRAGDGGSYTALPLGNQPVPALPSPLSTVASVSIHPPPPPRQYRALLTKNLTLLSRQRGLCLCQLFTPILILGLLLLLQSIVNSEVGEYSVFLIPPIYLPLNIYPTTLPPPQQSRSATSSEDFVRLLSVFSYPPHEQATALATLSASSNVLANAAAALASSSSAHPSFSSSTTCVRFYLSSVQPLEGTTPQDLEALITDVGALPRVEWRRGGRQPTLNSSGLLSFIPNPTWCPLHNGSLLSTPFFAPRRDDESALADAQDGGDRVGWGLDDELMRDLMLLNSADSSFLQDAPPCWNPSSPPSDPEAYAQSNCPALILPDGAWTVHALTKSDPVKGGGRLSVTIQPNTAASTRYHRPNGVSRPMPPAPSVLTIDAARLGAMDLLSRAFNKWSESAEDDSSIDKRQNNYALPLITFASTMAERHVQTTGDIVEILGAVLFVILLSAPLPLFIFVHVTEKELRLNEMQMIMGIRGGAMQAVNFGVNAALYVCIVALFWGVSGGYMALRTMSHTSALLLSLTFLGHCLALTATASLVGAFLWDRQVATVTGVVLGIITPLIATAIMAGVYGQNLPWALGVAPPPLLYALPVLGVQFALARVLYLATFTSLAFRVSLTSSSLDPFSSEVGVAIWSMYCNALLYTAAGWYLERVLPRRYGVAQAPLFCVPRPLAKFCVGRVLGKRFLPLFGGEVGDLFLRNPPLSSSPNRKKRGGGEAPLLLSLNDEEDIRPPESSLPELGSSFAYTDSWAAYAGLSPEGAARAYAKGEDSDVWEARQQAEIAWKDAWAQRNSIGNPPAGVVNVTAAQFPVIIRHLRKTFDLEAAARVSAGEEITPRAPHPLSPSSPLPPPSPEFAAAGGGEAPYGSHHHHHSSSSSSSPSLPLGNESDMGVEGTPYRELEQEVMTVSAGLKVAVSDQSIALAPGVFGLLGANGAGKTTTLAMLQGLYPPTSGGALVGGFDCQEEQLSVRLCLGVCPQHDVLWPMLTVAEHLTFYARAKGVAGGSAEQREVSAMLAHIGLTEFANRAASALSGGMRRRLSIGIAMIGARTRVVLLDELTTGLDPASRRAVWRIVDASRAANPGSLYLLVSHDMAEVEALCSGSGGRCGIMTHGRLRCVGSLQHLRERYGGGCLLRLVFSIVRDVDLREVVAAAAPPATWVGVGGGGGGGGGGLMLGAIPEDCPPTPAWVLVKNAIASTFPPGEGSARVDGAVFQTRSLGAPSRTHPPPPLGRAWVTEKGSAVFLVKVGGASTPGAEIPMAQAFRKMQGLAKDPFGAGITGWAIEAQTLDAVFSRVVRHYRK